MHFTKSDLEIIAKILHASPIVENDEIRFELRNPQNGFTLSLTIYQNVPFNDHLITIISALTPSGMYQLHNCTAYIPFEEEEIIFVSHPDQSHPYLSTMTIGKNASCSVFATCHTALLHTSFEKLDERLLLAAMQLALIDAFLKES